MLRLASAAVLLGALLVESAPAAAQATRPAAKRAASSSGSIEGDMFVVMRSGDTKPAAGRTVFLASLTDDAIVELARQDCERASHLPPGMDRDVRLQIAAGRFTLRPIATAGSGMNAHFRFPSVKPDQYLLLATATIYENRLFWVVPVSVSSGEPVRLDLDTSNAGQMGNDEGAVWSYTSSDQKRMPPSAGAAVCRILLQ